MGTYTRRLIAVTQEYEGECYLAETLAFPEWSGFGEAPARLREEAARQIVHLLEHAPLIGLHQRHATPLPAVREVRLALAPPRGDPAWQGEVPLCFYAACWEEAGLAMAFVPALGITVIAPSPATLETRLESHIRAALARDKATTSLKALAARQRGLGLQVEELSCWATIRTPKQLALEEDQEEQREPALPQVATLLNKARLSEAFAIDELVAQLADVLGGRTPRSVLLVGPPGVGKTAAVHQLVRTRRLHGLGHTPCWSTSGARLVAGMAGFGEWQERCRQVWQEATQARAILHLGHLVELLEVGKSAQNGQSIAGFLKPYLLRGDLLAIVECLPEQLAVIEREDPQLLEAFHRITVPEPTADAARRMLTRSAEAQAAAKSITLAAEALATIDRLHRRFATYSAYPGRPLRFLRHVLEDTPAAGTLTPPAVTAAFSRETGLPLFMIDDAIRFDPAQARGWFTARVIGQTPAVELVVNLLSTVKAMLTRPRKPIASLLFIGPTGVGKTEMAKALAEYLFGSRERMTRFDMTEYADPIAVTRLIGGIFGEEGLLTARVREQPFAVMLFDECEKADPLFFDYLLQVLGEGRLTDAAGRVADFSNTIIIMTSNLGAQSFGKPPIGFAAETGSAAEAEAHFQRAVQDFLRPELFNRLDHLVPFLPISEADLVRIAEREIGLVLQRDGLLLRDARVTLAPEVPAFLARVGYDHRYGARPLKRAIEQHLLAPLAEALNRYSWTQPLAIAVTLADGGLHVRACTCDDADEVAAQTSTAAELAARCGELRRSVQHFGQCSSLLDLQNELYRLQLRQRSRAKRRWNEETPRQYARQQEIEETLQTANALADRATALEELVLLGLYGRESLDCAYLDRELDALAEALWLLKLQFAARRLQDPHRAVLTAYGENRGLLLNLARAYHDTALAQGYTVTAFPLSLACAQAAEGAGLAAHLPAEFVPLPEALPEQTIAVALEVSGRHAFTLLHGEVGLHTLRTATGDFPYYVDVRPEGLASYAVLPGAGRRGAFKEAKKRRAYLLVERKLEDDLLRKAFLWTGDKFADALRRALDDSLRLLVDRCLAAGEGEPR